jgi:integrase
MTVFCDRVGYWRFDFRLNSRRHIGPCFTAAGARARNKREAKEAEQVERTRIRTGETARRSISRPGSFSLGQAMLQHVEGQVGSSPAHVRNLRLYAREILAYFGDLTPVVEITQAWVDEYRRDLAAERVQVWKGGPRTRAASRVDSVDGERTRSPAGVNHRLNCLRAALLRSHQTRDPVTGLSLLPFPPAVKPVPAPKRQPRPMPDDELQARLAAAPPWVRETAELARCFGLRRAEALTLELRHVDRGQRALRFSGDGNQIRPR